eukprot:3041373-Rhodomonas_salina.1
MLGRVYWLLAVAFTWYNNSAISLRRCPVLTQRTFCYCTIVRAMPSPVPTDVCLGSCLRGCCVVPGTDPAYVVPYWPTPALCEARYQTAMQYALAMRCPVLRWRLVLSAYALDMRCPLCKERIRLEREVGCPISLRANRRWPRNARHIAKGGLFSYANFSTEIAYGGELSTCCA